MSKFAKMIPLEKFALLFSIVYSVFTPKLITLSSQLKSVHVQCAQALGWFQKNFGSITNLLLNGGVIPKQVAGEKQRPFYDLHLNLTQPHQAECWQASKPVEGFFSSQCTFATLDIKTCGASSVAMMSAHATSFLSTYNKLPDLVQQSS